MYWALDIKVMFFILQINLPHFVSERYSHSLSVFTVGSNCIWIVVTGGAVEYRKLTKDGVQQYQGKLVSQHNNTMIIELGK